MADNFLNLTVRLEKVNFDKFVKRVTHWNFKKFLENTGELMLESFQTNIKAGGRGTRWPPLNPKYRKYKIKKWGTAKMLIASGKMFKSLFRGRPGNVFKVTRTSVEAGTDVRSGKGYPYWKPNQKTRRFIMLQRSDKEQIGKAFNWEVHRMVEG